MKRWLIFLFLFISNFIVINATFAQLDTLNPISIDKAFWFSAATKNKQTIIARWKIASGYYLYRDRFHFSTQNPQTTRLGQPILPKGIIKKSPELGQYQVYRGQLRIPIPVIQSEQSKVVLKVSYQGCAVKGFCYPPTTKIVTVNLAGPYMKFVNGSDYQPPQQQTQASTPHNKKIIQLLNGKSLLAFILGFLGIGVLISLTPCVLPMIPILSGIIIGQKHITTARSFLLSLCYVLGMAITYAVAGIIFGVIGSSVQAAFQKPWIIVLFSLAFVALALSLFGFYHIELPAKLRNRIAHASDRSKRGTYIGATVMGIFSTLILSPCVTPPLVGVLGYISQSGNAALGGIALFTMGIGMGVPLLVIGASGAKLLPKAGTWMNIVKNIMGILLLAMAIWMLGRILHGPIMLVLWAALAIGIAAYMGALSTATTGWQRVSKGLGLLFFVYGIILIVGAAMGSSNPLKPIPLSYASRSSSSSALHFIPVKTVKDVLTQLSSPKNQGKPVMLDFYADWCVSCKEMDHFTFSNPTVKQRLSHYLLLRADVTANDAEDKRLEHHFNVVAPPTVLFFDATNHHEIKNARIIGEMSAKRFLQHLNKIEQY